MRGVPTPDDKYLDFCKHYLVTGNASAAARAVGLSPFTGSELAKKARREPWFTEARKDLREGVLDDAERILVSGLEIGLERLNKEPPSLHEMADLGGKVHYQDSGAQYLRSIAAAVDVIHKLRRFEAERDGEIRSPGEVTINVAPTAAAAAKIDAGSGS